MLSEKTTMCGNSMEGRDGKCDIFCKKTVSSIGQNQLDHVWSLAMAELFR